MPRRNYADGMEITFGDLNKIPAGVERMLFDRVFYEMLQLKTDRFFGSGFLVSRLSGTQISVAAGVGFQEDATQVTPEPQKRLIYNAAAVTADLDGAHATLARIDIVCIRSNRATSASGIRKYKAPTTGVVTNETLVLETDWDADVLVVAGTAAGSPAAPATPAGYIRIAALAITAATGLGIAGVTDERAIMPVAGKILLSTLGFTKLTAAAERTLDQMMLEIDTALTGGGGGGGGMRWTNKSADGAVESEENGEVVFLFPTDVDARTTVFFMVPNGYVTGKQISLFLAFYSPTAATGWRMKTTTSLVRKNLDAITSVANQNAYEPAALVNTVASMMRRVQFELTGATGLVNGVAVTAGDLLKIDLTRSYADAGDTDTDDVRFIPSATEPKLS